MQNSMSGASTDSALPATFGADFYTYQYSATSIAGENAAAAANNVTYLAWFMGDIAVAAFMILGLLTIVRNGRKLSLAIVASCDLKEAEQQAKAAEEKKNAEALKEEVPVATEEAPVEKADSAVEVSQEEDAAMETEAVK